MEFLWNRTEYWIIHQPRFYRQSHPPFELDPSTFVENFCTLAAYLEFIVTILRNFYYIWK